MFKAGRGRSRFTVLVVPVFLVLALVIWQAAIALADSPQPNRLADDFPGSAASKAAGIDITANGPAAAIHGDPAAGEKIFAVNCLTCHGDRGTGNVPNPGSNDGTVPPLNPIDPGFFEDLGSAAGPFAQGIDLFIQHGSRPEGDSPKLSMINWGDQKLLNQQQIADVEAYIMQLNGVYWPDRWQAPADVRIQTTQTGNLVTYNITLVNEGATTMGHIDLKDTLPPGLTYVSSGLPSLGQNPGGVNGTTVEWINDDGIPQGGTLGPFIINAQVNGATVPANTAQLVFNWTAPDGTLLTSSVLSNPSVPQQAAPKPVPTVAVPTSVTPAPAPAAAATPTPAPSSEAVNTPTPVANNSNVATQTPAPAATAAPAAATPTPVPAAAAPATIGVQVVQPGDDATTWGYAPPSITIHVGDSVIWSNVGSLAHTVTADDGSFDSGLFNNGAQWSLTFNTAGTYSYHCTPHPWMKGTVVVQ